MSPIRIIHAGTLAFTVRPLIGRDLPQIAYLARETHWLPWLDQDLPLLSHPDLRLGWVAETAQRVVGFVLCMVPPSNAVSTRGIFPSLVGFLRGLVSKRAPRALHVKLIDLHVTRDVSRIGIERALLEQLEADLQRRGDRIDMIVPESNLAVQLLLREAEYQATQVLRGYYGSEDGYLMVSPQHRSARQTGQRSSVPGRRVGGAV